MKFSKTYFPNITDWIKANYTSWGKNFKVTDGKLTYADGTAIQQKGGYYVKPISVGDKLGLVYWDGTHKTFGMNIQCTRSNDTRTFHLGTIDGANPVPTNDDRVWLRSNGGIQHFTESPAKPQTFNLSSWNLTVEQLQEISNPLAFGNHIWHVI